MDDIADGLVECGGGRASASGMARAAAQTADPAMFPIMAATVALAASYAIIISTGSGSYKIVPYCGITNE